MKKVWLSFSALLAAIVLNTASPLFAEETDDQAEPVEATDTADPDTEDAEPAPSAEDSAEDNADDDREEDTQ